MGMEVGAGAGAIVGTAVGFGVGADTSGTTIRSLCVANQIAPILTARTTANAAASKRLWLTRLLRCCSSCTFSFFCSSR
jgi:hypothetical protein